MLAARLHGYTEDMIEALTVEEGGIALHTTEYDLEQINMVAEQLEHGDIEGRAVIKP